MNLFPVNRQVERETGKEERSLSEKFGRTADVNHRVCCANLNNKFPLSHKLPTLFCSAPIGFPAPVQGIWVKRETVKVKLTKSHPQKVA